MSAASETSDEVLHLPSHFRRPFADENPQRCPRKSCHFCFLPGKSTKVSGNPSPQGKTLGKNKRCKFQDKRQQSGRTSANFPDSLKNLREETKIKNTVKITKSDYPLEDGKTLVKTKFCAKCRKKSTSSHNTTRIPLTTQAVKGIFSFIKKISTISLQKRIYRTFRL